MSDQPEKEGVGGMHDVDTGVMGGMCGEIIEGNRNPAQSSTQNPPALRTPKHILPTLRTPKYIPPIRPRPQVTSTRQVLFKLFTHTLAMFTLPFVAYYGSKDYVEREYGLESPKSFIYGAVAAVIVVQAVIFSYVYQAFKEEQLEKRAAEAAAKRD